MKTITSIHNQIILNVSKLKQTQERKKQKLFCAEGYKLAKELLGCNIEPVFCFVLQSFDLSELPSGIDNDIVYVVSESVMKKISTMSTPPEIIIVAKEKEQNTDFYNDDFILALDCIQDPSNLGAILRSAEAFGAKTIILGEGCCDAYSAKNLRGSMGSIFRLNIVTENLETIIPKARNNGFTVIGTGLSRNFQTVDKLNNYNKKFIIIGNEGNGISEKVSSMCDFGMFIPMTGKNESLNAAVAASIILWENQRQNYGK